MTNTNNAAQSPAGVLAVLDREISRAGGEYYSDGRELIKARAAVVELVEAVEDTLQTHPAAGRYPDGPCIEKEYRARLKAALAAFAVGTQAATTDRGEGK